MNTALARCGMKTIRMSATTANDTLRPSMGMGRYRRRGSGSGARVS